MPVSLPVYMAASGPVVRNLLGAGAGAYAARSAWGDEHKKRNTVVGALGGLVNPSGGIGAAAGNLVGKALGHEDRRRDTLIGAAAGNVALGVPRRLVMHSGEKGLVDRIVNEGMKELGPEEREGMKSFLGPAIDLRRSAGIANNLLGAAGLGVAAAAVPPKEKTASIAIDLIDGGLLRYAIGAGAGAYAAHSAGSKENATRNAILGGLGGFVNPSGGIGAAAGNAIGEAMGHEDRRRDALLGAAAGNVALGIPRKVLLGGAAGTGISNLLGAAGLGIAAVKTKPREKTAGERDSIALRLLGK